MPQHWRQILRVFLSESIVSRIKNRRSERVEIHDTKLPGFCLRVGKQKLVWCWRGRVNQKLIRVSLGVWPATSADAARQQCIAWLQAQGQGVFLYSSKVPTTVDIKESPTLLEAFTRYISHKQLRETTLKTYGKQMRLYLHTLHNKRLDTIASGDVRKLYADLCNKTSAAKANGTLGLFKAIYNWANAVDDLSLPDIFRVLVVSGEKQATPKRDDVLLDSHIRQLGQAFPKLFIQHQQFILLGLFTGFRINELANLTPADIDFTACTITLHTTKNGRKHILPLSTSLENVVRPMCEGTPFTARLFSHGIRNHASIISRATGVAFTAHTMRRTFASTGIRLGLSTYVVNRLVKN